MILFFQTCCAYRGRAAADRDVVRERHGDQAVSTLRDPHRAEEKRAAHHQRQPRRHRRVHVQGQVRHRRGHMHIHRLRRSVHTTL